MEDRAAARRITGALFAAHAAGSAGQIATATVAAIVGAELAGRDAAAGMPAAVFALGTALASLFVGTWNERWGRRMGLTLGATVGATGMALAVGAAVADRFVPLLVGLALAGTAAAAVKLGRFTAAEVNPPERRGRAVSMVVLGGTVGSVLGPALVAPSGALTEAWGWGTLAGPYLATFAVFAIAAAVFALFLRPEPRLLAERLETARLAAGPPDAPPRDLRTLLRDRGVVTAVAAMVLAQGVMVLLMIVTPLHMREHAHALGAISLVFAGHTLGMYAFSLLSGTLTDRWGRRPVLLAGGALLVVACAAATASPGFVPMAAALFALGLGWNLCFVAGSALLSDHLTLREKARTQGANDLLMGLVSAAASLGGGLAYATAGYVTMAWGGGAVALAIVALAWVGGGRHAWAPRPTA